LACNTASYDRQKYTTVTITCANYGGGTALTWQWQRSARRRHC